jgi:signal recognition particle receptor subunit beta
MSEETRGTGAHVCRIVYCGPSESGKTTNLDALARLLSGKRNGKLIKLATDTERTLYFDMLTIDIGGRTSATSRLELFTVPGQSFYLSARRRVLREANGVVFVADSRRERLEANVEALGEVAAALQDAGREPDDVPAVLQLNKCDDATAIPATELLALLGCEGDPYVEAVASEGRGVVETLRIISRIALANSLQAEPTI